MKIEIVEIFDITTLEIAKSTLRQADIAFEVRGENTLQIGNVYALGNNGARIFVSEKDLENAKNLLINQAALKLNHDSANDEFKFVTWMQKKLNIGILKGTSFLTKLVFAFIVFAITFIIWGYNIAHKQLDDFLGNDSVWCVKSIEIDGKKTIPNSTAGVNNSMLLKSYSLYGHNCNEEINFRNDKIVLPGINNEQVAGVYQFNENFSSLSINLENKEVNQFYDGEFKIEFDNLNYRCTLVSNKARINLKLYNR